MAVDTSKSVIAELGGKVDNTLTNTTTSAITVNWRVISHNFPTAPSKWFTSFGVCDNNLCYGSDLITLSMGSYPTKTTNPIPGSSNMHLYASFGEISGAASGPFYVSIEVKEGSTTDTVTYIANKWPTAITTVKTNDNVIVYPNPAHDELNVIFSSIPDVKTLTVVNMIGKVVDVYKVNTNSAKINIENIPSGVYILRLTDSQGHVVVTRKFTHQ
jgi:hypothetical protein